MEELLGPLAVLYSWQSILLAFGVASLTHAVKGALDLKLGGKEERQRRLWANRVVLPLTPIGLGAVGGALIPLHPEALREYLSTHAVVGWKYYLALAAYGGAVGQFSDYVWHRYSGLRDDVKKRRKGSQSPPTRLPDGFTAPAPDPEAPAEVAEAPAPAPEAPEPPPAPAAPPEPRSAAAPTAPPAKPVKMPDGFTPPEGSGSSAAPTEAAPASSPTEPAKARRRRSSFRR